MAWFLKKEQRAEESSGESPPHDDVLLQAIMGRSVMTKTDALNIPSLRSCINLVADMVSMIPIKLYQESDGKAEEIKEDNRIRLLNDDTGDTLDAVQFWKAIITDYYLGKGGYAYINKKRNEVISLHYVDEALISAQDNNDPIFKDYDFIVNGKPYKPFDFMKILRNTKNGATGTSVIEENPLILSVAYNSLRYEENLVKKGGNKKGFIKSPKKLTQAAIDELKAAWRKLYGNNDENVVVLNDGLDFKESSNTSVEMQMNENKASNSTEICKLINIPSSLIKGDAGHMEYANAFRTGVAPVLRAIECALNRDLLLEKEKGSFYFAFDTKEMLKGDIKSRFEAYKIGIEANFLQVDEVRFMEDLPSLGLNYIKLGLDSVLYNPETKEIYTPNTNQTTVMDKDVAHDGVADDEIEGGDISES